MTVLRRIRWAALTAVIACAPGPAATQPPAGLANADFELGTAACRDAVLEKRIATVSK